MANDKKRLSEPTFAPAPAAAAPGGSGEPAVACSTPAVLTIEVAYARPDVQVVETVALAAGANVQQAIAASGLLQRFPEIDGLSVGIHGVQVAPSAPVSNGDRVEIYRPLTVDPKELRRRRARHRS
jgi:uncharacterized protein